VARQVFWSYPDQESRILRLGVKLLKQHWRPWILIIADDLTGALEAGARFAAQGLPSRVSTGAGIEPLPGIPVVVIDTETRHCKPDEAHAIVRELALAGRQHAPWLIYKKTDSTLRGNIPAEFQALCDVFPERPLVYAPAFPSMGRTVRAGKLYLHGVPVDATDFASDPLNPIHTSDIASLLANVSAQVCDGECDADIDAVAASIVANPTPPLAAGPAALAGALAERMPLPRAEVRSFPRLARCLVVNGSLHPASLAQIEYGRTHGCFNDGWSLFENCLEGAGLERALCNGERAAALLSDSPADALIVFGGDTAFGIHRALGEAPFDPYAEILPGVPLSRRGGLFWITKAGGFGGPDILCEIRRRLS
jgi:D-threonate/D-erythronate kinase